MQVVNYTPFPHFVFERNRSDGLSSTVVVAQGTFAIENGKPLHGLPEQEPVQLAEQNEQVADVSVLTRDTGLATYKPNSDIHVHARGWAPDGRAVAKFPVRVRVGKVQKDLEVRGPHEWEHSAVTGWQLSEPRPCIEVPIRYDKAFGGSWQVGGKEVREPDNPVGTGFLPRGVPTDTPVPAPQVVAVDEPTHRPGGRYRPQGYGPMPPYYAQRVQLAGTYDEGWLKEQWPHVASDFDEAYFNSAHPDLVYPGYLEGDEAVELVHLIPGGGTQLCQLPGWTVYAVLRHAVGANLPMPMHLDTVHFDLSSERPADHRVYLSWRMRFPVAMNVGRLELRVCAK